MVGFCDDAENYVYDQATDSCVKDDDVCRLGSILYSDITCSMKLKDGKTPIGVVVYVDESGTSGQAMALKLIGYYEWGPTSNDISTLTNYSSASAASKDYDSCGNTAKIIAAGDKSKYPAAWAAHEYKTEGTNAGDWCLPAAGIFTSIFNNVAAINNSFILMGGTGYTNRTYSWSSSEYDGTWAWHSGFDYDYGILNYQKIVSSDVQPVLEFSQGGISCDSSYQYTCTGEGEIGLGDSCNGKYKSCTCDSSYQYTCTGEGEIGSGGSCNGKYKSCTCEYGYYWNGSRCIARCDSPYVWNGSDCVCASSYNQSCTGSNEAGGSGDSCDGLYASCNCISGYRWVGCKFNGVFRGCLPDIGEGSYACDF